MSDERQPDPAVTQDQSYAAAAPEAAGRAVGGFYRGLLDAGLEREDALWLADTWMREIGRANGRPRDE